MKIVYPFCIAFVIKNDWIPKRLYCTSMTEVLIAQSIINEDSSIKRAVLFDVSPDNHTLTSVIKELNTPLYKRPL